MKEINPHDLKKKIDNDENIFILDVRTPQEYESWRLSYDKHNNPKLIPVDTLLAQDSSLLKDIPKDKEIITVCAHGMRSMMAASMLDKLGYNVKSLSGGMAGWNRVYDVAQVPVPNESSFRIWQIRRVSKGCMGYIISSTYNQTAVAIDPSREIYESFLKVAQDNGLEITKVIDTHQHVDHVSGVAKLVKTLTAQTSSERFAYFSTFEEYEGNKNNELKIRYIKDGDEIDVGRNVKLRALHTPGHTRGSMSFFLEDTNENYQDKDKPDGAVTPRHYLFTGDTIFIDGIGRPDLRDDARSFAGLLYDTYHQKIALLPENTLVLPAHFDTGSISLKHTVPIFETMKSLKAKIKLLSQSKEDFINFVTETVPPKPVNYKTIMSINKKMLSFDEMEIPDLEAGPNSCGISSK